MIDFKTNIKELLPYDREKYIDFLDDSNLSTQWHGVSFQLDKEDKKNNITEFVEFFEPLFKSIILKLDIGSFWIVNHDDKDLKWFPNDEENLTKLRTLFKQRNIPNSFVGAIIFTKDDLLKVSTDLISYPYAVFNNNDFLYKNLDVSHSKMQFIIKISGHLNIDIITTDKNLLRDVIDENTRSFFKIKEYYG